MLVTPKNRKFGRYALGETFELADKPARALIKVGKLLAANQDVGYQTRMLQAQPVSAPVVSPVVVEKDAAAVQQEDGRVEDSKPSVDLDSENMAWDEALHVSTKLKNADGTWRKKPGARAAS